MGESDAPSRGQTVRFAPRGYLTMGWRRRRPNTSGQDVQTYLQQ